MAVCFYANQVVSSSTGTIDSTVTKLFFLVCEIQSFLFATVIQGISSLRLGSRSVSSSGRNIECMPCSMRMLKHGYHHAQDPPSRDSPQEMNVCIRFSKLGSRSAGFVFVIWDVLPRDGALQCK